MHSRIPTTERHIVLLSRQLAGNAAFSQVLLDAGMTVWTGTTTSDVFRTVLKRTPCVVVAEIGRDAASDETILALAGDYTQSHDATVFLLSHRPVPSTTRLKPPGAIQWIDVRSCHADFVAHLVVDAAGGIEAFDRECADRFEKQRAVEFSSPADAVRAVISVHAKWEALPDDQKPDCISDLIYAASRLDTVAQENRLRQLSQVAAAICGLAEKIRTIPQRMNASIAQTIRQAVSLLPALTTEVELGAQPGGPCVLVLDDIDMIRRLHCAALEGVNLHVVPVDNPERAIELITTQRFDLVLLDIHMPKIDGFEVCQALKESPLNAATPALFITGLRDVETKNRSAASSAVDFIAKPVLNHELALKALIHLHRARRRIAA